MRALVTGAGGLIGTHLIEALSARGDTVQGWLRSSGPTAPEANAAFVGTDITDRETVRRNLESFAPDIAFHLAAQSSPGRSWDDPEETYRVNVLGTLNLLEAARQGRMRLLLAGSSAEYADPPDGAPLTEASPIQPNSPYGASKAAATALAELYHRRYGLDVIVFRPFFLVGPRKMGDVCSDFARRIVAVERGRDRGMRVGDLSVVRDVMDVRDGVSALLKIAERGVAGSIYNIASGRGTAIEAILNTYLSLTPSKVDVRQDTTLLRPLEQAARVGDPGKLRLLGWREAHELRETLSGILDYWRGVGTEESRQAN
jgi:GDP-4-dehydro-6-deoxy-D-mannose reductase